jgi:phosphomannomutase
MVGDRNDYFISKQNETLSAMHFARLKQTLINENVEIKNAAWNIICNAIKNEMVSNMSQDEISEKVFEREGLTIIKENGWINVRSSNTEPLIRISIGAENKELAQLDLDLLKNIVKKIDGSN